MKYSVVGFFTDRDENCPNDFGFFDKDHWQYTCEKVFDTVDEAKEQLDKVVLDIIEKEYKENGETGRAKKSEDGMSAAIFYFDGDISSYKVEELSFSNVKKYA